MAAAVEIVPARTPAEIAAAKALCLEYAASLDVDLCFQDFDREIEDFPGKYGPPAGALLLARVDGVPQGVVALRPLSGGRCEMKRLYVRPAARGLGLGRRLAEAVLAAAGARGYLAIRLDTLPAMETAIGLYRELGFCEIAAYTHNPVPGAMFMERGLR